MYLTRKEVNSVIKHKRAYGLVSAILIGSMFFSLMLPVASAQVISQVASLDSWQPPEDFVNPVTLKINEFRAAGLSDEEITVQLAALGMGWYPATGATWIGEALSPEEADEMLMRKPATESSTKSESMQPGSATRTVVGRTSVMRTNKYSWTGVAAEIVCGSMSTSSGGTLRHYLCVQLGDLDCGTDWAEIVVTHNYGEVYKWYLFDLDEGAWIFLGNKNTPAYATDTFVIMLSGVKDSHGWVYDVWINYVWKASGHISSHYVQAGHQKEIYSEGQFTDDTSDAIFFYNWLHDGSSWSYWTNSTSTKWLAQDPLLGSHTLQPSSYKWRTWTQN